MRLARHNHQRLTEADRPEAAAPATIARLLVLFHDLGELIALAVRTAAHPSAGNAGPIPTFPGDSQADSHRIRTVPCSTAQPAPPRSHHAPH